MERREGEKGVRVSYGISVRERVRKMLVKDGVRKEAREE